MKSAQFVIRGIPVFLMISILFAGAEQTQAYGTSKESCTTRGIQIAVGVDISKIVKAGNPGDTFLLRRGSHRLKRHVIIPQGTANRPITIKPYNCEDVTLQMNGRNIQPNDYSIIAGLVLAAMGSSGHAIIKATETSSDPRTNIIIRNNEFIGGAALFQIRLTGNIQDVIISGNKIQHAKDKLPTLHMQGFSSRRPHNILINANKFSNCGEDCFQPKGAGTFILSNNNFTGPTKENLVDIKSIKSDSFILDNVFQCDNSMKACMLLHGQNAKGTAVMIEENVFFGCPIVPNQTQLYLGKKNIPNTYHVRDNTFDLLNTSCRALAVRSCVNCKISNNAVID